MKNCYSGAQKFPSVLAVSGRYLKYVCLVFEIQDCVYPKAAVYFQDILLLHRHFLIIYYILKSCASIPNNVLTLHAF